MSKQKKTVFNEKEAIQALSNKYGFKEDELQNILKENLYKNDAHKNKNISRQVESTIICDIKLPVKIIAHPKLSPLEAIVKYLRENKDLTYKQIATLIYRDPKTLAVTYSVAQKKISEKITLKEDNDINQIYIDFSIFAEADKNSLSILETICMHLKSLGYNYSQISRILAKSQKTVWTVCKRAEFKLSNKKLQGGEQVAP